MDYEEYDWLEEAEASDQVVWNQNSLDRLEREWEPSEAEDDAAVDEAVDSILPYIGDVQENAYDPDAPISTATLLAQLDEVSVERRTQVARTVAEFDELIKEMDRLDRNRERRERYHEILQEEYIPGGEEFYSGRIFPAALDSPESKLILRGMFLDLFYNCPYEMHQLTADPFLSRIVDELSDLHKETLYLLSLQYLSTSQLAHMRDQSDRNIRKLRDSHTKKLQKQLYGHLLQKKQDGMGLSFREKEFLTQYELALKESGTANVKVKKENKYPKRIRKFILLGQRKTNGSAVRNAKTHTRKMEINKREQVALLRQDWSVIYHFAPPVMQLYYKNPLPRFPPFRFTTYTRTVGFRVSESTHFRPRRDRSSVCSAVTGNGMLSKAASPFRQQRSQKV